MHKVTYSYAGEIPAEAPALPGVQQYAKNTTVGVSSDPSLSGYTFSGWSTSDATVSGGKFVMPDKDVAFVGTWTKNAEETKYVVTYVIDGKDKPSDFMPPKAKGYVEGASVDLDSTEKGAVIDGYVFSGWTSSDVELSETGFEMPSKNVAIHGSFERIGYMVCYEFMNQPQPANAASLIPACEKHYPGEKVALAPNPTAEGFRFTGWYAKNGFTMPEKDVLIQGEWSVQNGVFAPEISKVVIDKKDQYYIDETVDFKITVKNTANYEIKDVFVEEDLEGVILVESADGQYSIETPTIVVIPSISAGQSVDIFANYKVTENEAKTIKNIARITGAIADDKNNFDDTKEYVAEAEFETAKIFNILSPKTYDPIVSAVVMFVAAATVFVAVVVVNRKTILAIVRRINWKKAAKLSVPCLAIVGVVIGGELLNSVFAATYTEPVKSVELTSQYTSFAKGEAGAWNIEKSAKWIDEGKARITFEVNTIAKRNEHMDVVLVLDDSGSMIGEKIERVKADAADLVKMILEDNESRVAMVSFDTIAAKRSDLSNDKEELLYRIDALSANGNTNYYDALKVAGGILEGYEKQDNRDLVLLFLTDGYPNEDIPNQIAQYKALKEAYPYLVISGIQYEMGEDILDPIIEISDRQFKADMVNLDSVLPEAIDVINSVYEDFELSDYINSDYWDVESVDSIESSIGEVKLQNEDGMPKVTWSIKNGLTTGGSATLTIDIKLKDGIAVTDDLLLPTNKKETISSKLNNVPSENITSEKTPVLRATVKVTYEPNLPSGCQNYTGTLPETKFYTPMSIVEKTSSAISCNGYSFRGWQIAEGKTKIINDDYFKIFDEDVVLKAVWTKVSITKSMEGQIKEAVAALLDTGQNISTAFKKASGQSSAGYNTANSTIKAIKTAPSMTESEKNKAQIISLSTSPAPIYAWYNAGTIYVYTEANKIEANSNMSQLLSNNNSLTDISALADWNMSNTTNMSYMFNRNTSLTDISPIAKWNVGNVTNMKALFNGASKLADISALADWDTSSVTNMADVFDAASSLRSVAPLAKWNTSKVTDMSYMFYSNTALSSLSGLEKWDTGNVTNMGNLFSSDSALTDISALANWNTSSVTNMTSMLSGLPKLTDISALANWNTSSVTSMYNMFGNDTNIESISALAKWDTSKVTNMSYMFGSISKLTSLSGLEKWDTGNVTNMNNMFNGNTRLADISALKDWNTGNVTDMGYLLQGDSSIADISALANWNTGKVTNMTNIFRGIISLTSLSGLEKWNTSSVKNMNSAFRGNTKLVDVSSLKNWNTSSVTDMAYMFQGDTKLSDLSELEGWNTSMVTKMGGMFDNVPTTVVRPSWYK